MPTNRNRRTRKSGKPIIPKALIYYFKTGDEDQSGFDECDRYNVFLIDFPLGKGADIGDLWNLCRDEIMADWKRAGKRGRPWAAKEFDHEAPKKRG